MAESTSTLRKIATMLAAASIVIGSMAFGAQAVNESSKIVFTATQSEVAVDGGFGKFAADVVFDPASPAAGKVNIVINLGSVATGSSEADDLLKSRDFFDIAHFPQATFVSTTIGAKDAGHYQAVGQFTLKGRSAGIVVPFTAHPEGTGLRIEGSVTVSRLAYHVGEGQWADTGTLVDQVQIHFSLYVPKQMEIDGVLTH
jgi:polyisoprenoid-binding protein YceI